MEQEKEVEEVSDSRQKARETFDIEGIGEFRAKPGTAVAELAGAASYWEKRAKQGEELMQRSGKNRWQSGFTAGMSASFAIVLVVASIIHFLAN